MRKRILALGFIAVLVGCRDRVTSPAGEPDEGGLPSEKVEPVGPSLSLVAERVNDPLLWEAIAGLPRGSATRKLTDLLKQVEARARGGDLPGTSLALASAEELVSSRFRGKDPLFPDVVGLLLDDISASLEASAGSGERP